MNEELLKQLSDSIGVTLSIRDNEKLMQETCDHLESQLLKKQQATRDNGVACIDESGTIEKFYSKGNRKD